MCCTIGHIVVLWGYVEYNLYFCLSTIYIKYGCKTTNQKIPKFLKRQIEYLRKCFESDLLLPFKDQGLLLINRIASLSKKRDEIIHSTYFGIEKASINFKKFGFNTPKRLYINDVEHTMATLLDTQKKIDILANDLVDFYYRLEG